LSVVQKYIRENYESIVEIAKVITQGRKPDYEDLAHEVILSVLTGNRDKMNLLVEKNQMRYWIIRLCINNYRSNTSRYHYKYRKPNERHLKAKEHLNYIKKLDEVQEKKWNEVLLNFIEEKLQDVDWFEKNCFAIYYGDKHSLNSMAKETGISRNTLYRAISDVRNYIKNEIKKQRFRRYNS
jgi:RNA polymerase sigma factor (sigma-70 family)